MIAAADEIDATNIAGAHRIAGAHGIAATLEPPRSAGSWHHRLPLLLHKGSRRLGRVGSSCLPFGPQRPALAFGQRRSQGCRSGASPAGVMLEPWSMGRGSTSLELSKGHFFWALTWGSGRPLLDRWSGFCRRRREFGRSGPTLAELSRARSKSGPMWPDLGHLLPEVGQIWGDFDQIRPILARARSNSDQFRPSSGRI